MARGAISGHLADYVADLADYRLAVVFLAVPLTPFSGVSGTAKKDNRSLKPGCKPLCPSCARQASRRQYITSFSHFTVQFCAPTEANFLALLTPEGRDHPSDFLHFTSMFVDSIKAADLG